MVVVGVLRVFGVPARWASLAGVAAGVAAIALVVADAPGAVAEPRVAAQAVVDQSSSGAAAGGVVDPATGELTAPDGLAASVMARLRGVRVEDLSQRSETGSVFALPSGQWQAVMATGPVWVHTAGDGTSVGDWAAADATLRRQGADWVPVAHSGAVVVSGGQVAGTDGRSVVARVTDPVTGLTSELTWPGDLPAPTVAGPRATFAEVEPGVDMVVEVTGTGVEQFFVVKDRAAAERVGDLPMGLTTRGATAKATGQGAVAMVDGRGRVAARVTAPEMWDARADAQRANPVTRPWDEAAQPALWAVGEDPAAGKAPASTRDQGASAVVDAQVSTDGDSARVSLEPSAAFVDDPATVFPVVIDPSVVALNVAFDATVESDIPSSDLSGAADLLIGTWNGGGMAARSFLGFTVSSIKGLHVDSATLNLWMYHSYSCNAREWQVWSTGAASTATRWSSQPVWSAKYATSTVTKGYSSSCADGWVNVPVTSLAQAWADNGTTTNYLGLRAASETDSYGWKRFNSGNASSGKPTLSVTYSHYPSTPSGSSFGAGQYAWYPNSSDANRVLYVRESKPSFSAVVADADGGNVRAKFDVLSGTTVKWTGALGTSVTSGSRSSFDGPPSTAPALADGTYTARSWAYDGALTSKASQSLGSFVIDTQVPSTPTVTASSYAPGQWLETPPADNTFTFASTASDLVAYQYKQDGAATWIRTNTVGAAVVNQLHWNPGAGAHTLQVQALDRALNASAEATFSFGTGGAELNGPVGGAKSTDAFTVNATAPPVPSGSSVIPAVYWRAAGTPNGSGYDPATGSTDGWTLGRSLPAISAGTTVSVDTTLSGAAAASTLGMDRVPLTIDVQVCFTYTDPASQQITRCTWNDAASGKKPTVTRVPHAFGDAFPTAPAGPGQVALWTGEFNTSATDVSVPGYVGDLSVSRTYSTLAGPDAGSVFGPGWAASFDGTDIGVAGYQVVDNSKVDGTYALVDAEGGALVYRQPGEGQVLMQPGIYTPVDEDTAAAGATLTLTGSGATAQLVFTSDDGTITTFTPVSFTAGVTPVWAPASVTEPGQAGSTTFTRDAAGRTTRILAPVPPGVSCATTLVAGCRALAVTYATTTTATASVPGDVAGQVRQIDYTAYDPSTAAMATTTVATYAYNTAHQLVSVTDPRTGLSTGYTYSGTSTSGQPLLVTVTPPGQAPFTLTYGQAPRDAMSLLAVARADAGDGLGAQKLARFVYAIAPATATAGLPAMGTADVAAWGQQTAPTYAAGVFGPDHQGVTTSDAADVPAADWPYASVQYTDDQGRVVNTAAYGAGAWQLTATGYDDAGRVVRELDQRAIAAIREVTSGGVSLSQEELDSYATLTRYNTDVTSTAAATGPGGTTVAAGTVITPAGTLVTDTWSPAAENADGVVVRTHTHTDYDTGAPNHGVNPATGVGYRLPTQVTVTTADALTGSPDPAVPVATGETVLTRTTSGYDPIDTAPATDPTSGWTLGQATTSTVVTDLTAGTGPTTRTRYDGDGRVLETLQPMSAGTDAGTTFVAYYTAAAQSGDTAACGAHPEWAGLACRTWHPDATLPVTVTTYSRYLAPSVVTETVGSASRTTTTTYDTAGRPVTTHTEATGLTGSAPVPVTRTLYDPSTGAASAVVSETTSGVETGRITTGYDGWGRVVTYTDTDAQATTTTYNAAGQVATVVDPTGTTTLAYDGPGEHRGLLTAQTVTGVGTFTATYDGAGDLVTQTMPGGLTQTTGYDRAGQDVSLSYSDTSGALAWWSLARDELGRVVTQTGSSRDGGQRTTAYTYDRAARLIGVADTAGGACTTRGYGFDDNGNRTALTTTTYETDCASTVTGTTTKAWAYDTADRVGHGANATGDYVYDPLGRQTLLPAVDTPSGAGAGDLSVGYFDDDLAHTLTQGAASTTFSLDPAARRQVETTTDGVTTTTTTRHYADTSDNPAWATVNDGTTTTTTRYAGSISGDLSAATTDGVTTLVLTDPHGDTATTIALEAGGPVPGPSGAYDEYGNPLAATPATGAIGYGWLGAKERPTNPTTGLILMGVRPYNTVTGLFTSVDPVPGGNTTAYTYPQDPINKYDITGKSWWSSIKKGIRTAWNATGSASTWLTNSTWGKRIEVACSLAWGAVGAVCNGVYAAAYARQGRWVEAGIAVAGAVAGKAATEGIKALGAASRLRFSAGIVRMGNGSRRVLRGYDRAILSIAEKFGVVVSYRTSYELRRRWAH